jgi:host factor-I protein
MMPKTPAGSLQETVLQHLCNQKVPVTIYLVNGVRLQGVVAEVDSYSFLLIRGHDSQLVYKSAVLSMMPDQSSRVADVSSPTSDHR